MKTASPLALIYHMPQAQVQKVKFICSQLHIETKQLEDEMASAPLGLAAGAKDWRNPLLSGTHNVEHPEPLSEPLLVMAGFDETLLDRFLALLRVSQLVIPMKAVLTPNNANWNALQLAAHIAEERKAILSNAAAQD